MRTRRLKARVSISCSAAFASSRGATWRRWSAAISSWMPSMPRFPRRRYPAPRRSRPMGRDEPKKRALGVAFGLTALLLSMLAAAGVGAIEEGLRPREAALFADTLRLPERAFPSENSRGWELG